MKRMLLFLATNRAVVLVLCVHQGEPNAFATGASKP